MVEGNKSSKTMSLLQEYLESHSVGIGDVSVLKAFARWVDNAGSPVETKAPESKWPCCPYCGSRLEQTQVGRFKCVSCDILGKSAPETSDNPHIVTEYQRGFDDGFRRRGDAEKASARPQPSALDQTAPPLWDCACNLTACPYCGPKLSQKASAGSVACTYPDCHCSPLDAKGQPREQCGDPDHSDFQRNAPWIAGGDF